MYYKVAAAFSALVVVAWAVFIAAWPADDAQIGIGYLFLTLYVVVALLLIWVLAAVLSRFATQRRQAPIVERAGLSLSAG